MIQKQDWDQLMNQARVKLVGASDKGLYAEFFDVLSEFLDGSSVWTQDITVAYNSTNITYPLFVPSGQIIRLEGVANWGTTVPTSTTVPSQAVTFVPALLGGDFATLVLKCAQNQSGYFSVSVVTNTKLPTDKYMIPDAPDWLLPVYHRGLLDGLLGKMMTQPEKSYTDKTQGTYHLKRFRDAIAQARAGKLQARTRGASAWRFPQSFRATSQQSGVPAIGSASERSF